jgi:hypothetical protein
VSSYATINDTAISAFFRSQVGPMAREVNRRARRLKNHAETNLAPHHRSGDAEAALRVTEMTADSEGISVRVGTDAAHAWRGHEPFNYPIALEFGGVTPQGTPYGPYPFLRPAAIAAGFRPVA